MTVVSEWCCTADWDCPCMTLPWITVALWPLGVRAAGIGRPDLHETSYLWYLFPHCSDSPSCPVLTPFLFPPKGDGSKSGSEADFYTQSIDDVCRSKKDVSASSGEIIPLHKLCSLYYYYYYWKKRNIYIITLLCCIGTKHCVSSDVWPYFLSGYILCFEPLLY